jgi:hypothetical protein
MRMVASTGGCTRTAVTSCMRGNTEACRPKIRSADPVAPRLDYLTASPVQTVDGQTLLVTICLLTRGTIPRWNPRVVCSAQRAPTSTIIWALSQQMTPTLSCTSQAFMSLQSLIGTAIPSWQSTSESRVAPRRLSTPWTAWSILTHYPARSGAKIKATFRLCRSTSLKRGLRSSSGGPSAGSRSDW